MNIPEEIIRQAKEAALKARLNAHAPYSHFLVGAVLIDESGNLWEGCNVEASSYGLTICAERSALVGAVSRGVKSFKAVVVCTDTQVPTSPCGACRQMLIDFAPDAVVVMINTQGSEVRMLLKELLPAAFTAAQLF
ncbi:MAG TPA: cytidine deaminase [Patescibacteria group bacterium]|nr:cytidine deaminase [Patescibacteria group bacterium]